MKNVPSNLSVQTDHNLTTCCLLQISYDILRLNYGHQILFDCISHHFTAFPAHKELCGMKARRSDCLWRLEINLKKTKMYIFWKTSALRGTLIKGNYIPLWVHCFNLSLSKLAHISWLLEERLYCCQTIRASLTLMQTFWELDFLWKNSIWIFIYFLFFLQCLTNNSYS